MSQSDNSTTKSASSSSLSVRFVSLLMGIWFISSFMANLGGGIVASYVKEIEMTQITTEDRQIIEKLSRMPNIFDVLVNSIAPSVISTEMNAATAPEVLEYMISKIPMSRPGSPDEVAALAVWLSSDECSFSTGACYDISGGRATY